MQGFDYISYETFGRRFFEVAVTEERVGAAFAAIAGSQFDMPPMAQGPGKIAKVSANVTIKQPQVTRNVDDSITFDIHIPLLIGYGANSFRAFAWSARASQRPR